MRLAVTREERIDYALGSRPLGLGDGIAAPDRRNDPASRCGDPGLPAGGGTGYAAPRGAGDMQLTSSTTLAASSLKTPRLLDG